MTTGRRFFDDERVRDACLGLVAREGEQEFFGDRGWRARLHCVARETRRTSTGGERFEAPEEAREAIRWELETSKRIIEEKLPGKTVDHLCYPWFEASREAVDISREVGYRVSYFGYQPNRATNRPGDDLLGIVRVDDLYLRRLPGTGRLSLPQILHQEYFQPRRPRTRPRVEDVPQG